MKRLRKLTLFVLAIIIYLIPLTVFAEGENLPVPSEIMIQANNFTTESMTIQSTSGDLAAANSGVLSGFVWNDANPNGEYESDSENPISGISVYLYISGNQNPSNSTTTTAKGEFSFTGLARNNYEIVISKNNKFGPNSSLSPYTTWNGTSKTNNFFVRSSDPSSWTTGTISLSNGQTLSNFGFGIYDPSKLAGTTSTTATTTETQATNTNPKTGDETLYIVPIIGLLGAISVYFISRKKIKAI